MDPLFYLKPDNKKLNTFFQSFSMTERDRLSLNLLNVDTIWIDESEKSWRVDYLCPVPVSTELLELLTNGIKKDFHLTYLIWEK